MPQIHQSLSYLAYLMATTTLVVSPSLREPDLWSYYMVVLCLWSTIVCTCNWGERSESLPSLQRCNFVCMSVCLYVCMYPYVMDRHNDLLLGLMIVTDFHVDSS